MTRTGLRLILVGRASVLVWTLFPDKALSLSLSLSLPPPSERALMWHRALSRQRIDPFVARARAHTHTPQRIDQAATSQRTNNAWPSPLHPLHRPIAAPLPSPPSVLDPISSLHRFLIKPSLSLSLSVSLCLSLTRLTLPAGQVTCFFPDLDDVTSTRTG